MEEAVKPDICRLIINGKEYESFEVTEETAGHAIEMIEWILDDIMDRWEERFEDCKGASYIAINLEIGDQHFWRLWTRAKTIAYQADDGWFSDRYPITDLPISIIADAPDRPFAVKGSPSTDWLYNDINHFTGLQVDYLAELKITDQVHWGFNGFNAVMLFKQKCDEYTSINKLGEEFVEMKYNPDIGYWFGEIKEETIDSDINLYYKGE